MPSSDKTDGQLQFTLPAIDTMSGWTTTTATNSISTMSNDSIWTISNNTWANVALPNVWHVGKQLAQLELFDDWC